MQFEYKISNLFKSPSPAEFTVFSAF